MGVSTERWVRPLAWATLVANIVLVVTGGAVRLTGSGLGCPTWPRCTDASFRPHGELSLHEAIEFGNRTLTFVLVAVAIATYVVMWRTGRRDLRAMALIVALGIPAQAIIGGVTVLTDLNPWVVSFHLLCSLAIIGVAVRLLLSVDAPLPLAHRGPQVGLAWATFAAAWAVIFVGTVVTGSGPHAGDVDTERNGLVPAPDEPAPRRSGLPVRGAHPRPAVHLMAVGGNPAARRAVTVLLVVEVAQGSIGFVQYFTDLPVVLVGFHMLGAAVISACCHVGAAAGAAAGGASPLACGDGLPRPHDPRRRPTRARVRRLSTDQCPWGELGAQRDVPAGRQVRRDRRGERSRRRGWTPSSPSSPRSRARGCR